MADSLNPAAPHHLPIFINAPGDTDVLMVVTGIILVLSVVAFGVLFLRLHTLPERMAHKSQKIQFEIVAVLGLLALFTHIHAFWVAALLLALIDFPDVGSFLGRIAGSVEKIAGVAPSPEAANEVQAREIPAGSKRSAAEAAALASETYDRDGRGHGTSTPPLRPESAPVRTKEASHA
jgi:multisubunit Na+/H+ antiporter MnhF subunit